MANIGRSSSDVAIALASFVLYKGSGNGGWTVLVVRVRRCRRLASRASSSRRCFSSLTTIRHSGQVEALVSHWSKHSLQNSWLHGNVIGSLRVSVQIAQSVSCTCKNFRNVSVLFGTSGSIWKWSKCFLSWKLIYSPKQVYLALRLESFMIHGAWR